MIRRPPGLWLPLMGLGVLGFGVYQLPVDTWPDPDHGRGLGAHRRRLPGGHSPAGRRDRAGPPDACQARGCARRLHGRGCGHRVDCPGVAGRLPARGRADVGRRRPVGRVHRARGPDAPPDRSAAGHRVDCPRGHAVPVAVRHPGGGRRAAGRHQPRGGHRDCLFGRACGRDRERVRVQRDPTRRADEGHLHPVPRAIRGCDPRLAVPVGTRRTCAARRRRRHRRRGVAGPTAVAGALGPAGSDPPGRLAIPA